MNRPETAVACFKQGYSCSQAIFATYCGALDRDKALKIASGFGGGMARLGLTCGAVTGAVMAIGLKHGGATGAEAAKQKTYELVREFKQRFEARNGSLICKDLLGCDIGTPEGMAEAREKQLFQQRCARFVRDTVELVENGVARQPTR